MIWVPITPAPFCHNKNKQDLGFTKYVFEVYCMHIMVSVLESGLGSPVNWTVQSGAPAGVLHCVLGQDTLLS